MTWYNTEKYKIMKTKLGRILDSYKSLNVPSFQTQDASNELNRSGKGQLSRLLMSFLEDRML